jgi:hypothetical protein
MKINDKVLMKNNPRTRGTVVKLNSSGSCIIISNGYIIETHVDELEKDDEFARNDRFRQRNYDLCTAINLTNLSIICNRLVHYGADEKRIKGLATIARETLELLRSLNEELEKGP